MCNAWNHPPGCTCGWGGEGHLGRGTGGSSPVSPYGGTGGPLELSSFTTPNASCPVCKVPVFYYQSPDGGRVFFDELGPPWPKHPCTSIRRAGSRPLRPRSPPPAPRSAYRYSWQADGWEPFLPDEIRSYTPELFHVSGDWHGRRQDVFMLRSGPSAKNDFRDCLPYGPWQLKPWKDAFKASILSPGISPNIRTVFPSEFAARIALRRQVY